MGMGRSRPASISLFCQKHGYCPSGAYKTTGLQKPLCYHPLAILYTTKGQSNKTGTYFANSHSGTEMGTAVEPPFRRLAPEFETGVIFLPYFIPAFLFTS